MAIIGSADFADGPCGLELGGGIERADEVVLITGDIGKQTTEEGDAVPDGLVRAAFETVIPFHPLRLCDLLQQRPTDAFCVSGVGCVASRPAHVAMLNAAGPDVTTRASGAWWTAMSESRLPTTPAVKRSRKTWHSMLGDRTNPLTRVGRPEAVQALQCTLEVCSVTQEEADAGAQWHTLPHTFPWPDAQA